MKFVSAMILTAVIVVIDLWVKYLVQKNLDLHQEIEIIKGFFNINYLHNPGAAFGLFANLPSEFRKWFFAVLTTVAIVIICMLLRSTERTQKIERFALASILGGAVANALNRFYLGYVIDFLHFHWQYKYHYPSFNIADIAIVSGVAALLFRTFFVGKEPQVQELFVKGNS